MPARSVSIVVYDGVQVLDVTGPGEVFSMANRYLGPTQVPYAVELVARSPGEIVCSGGLRLVATRGVDDVRRTDTLVVAGGDGAVDAVTDETLLGAIRRLSAGARRTASVCTGAFLLGAAGVLDGRRVTTHWTLCELLARHFPTTAVEPDAIYVRDAEVTTSAGITTGIDLALAFVEEDHGIDVARRVARQLVVFLQRPGGQSQFSVHLDTRLAERSSVRQIQSWIADHLADDLSVRALAAESGMSVRNFARVFRRDVGMTPADYVEAARIEAAKRLLETTTAGVGEIARACGFGSVATLHRAFRRCVGVTPGAFRARFRPAIGHAPARV